MTTMSITGLLKNTGLAKSSQRSFTKHVIPDCVMSRLHAVELSVVLSAGSAVSTRDSSLAAEDARHRGAVHSTRICPHWQLLQVAYFSLYNHRFPFHLLISPGCRHYRMNRVVKRLPNQFLMWPWLCLFRDTGIRLSQETFWL